jgi:coatomer subunit beta
VEEELAQGKCKFINQKGIEQLRMASIGVAAADKPCTILINYERNEIPQLGELKKTLEIGSKAEKIEALKTVILLKLNGEPLTQLLMTIIRFVMPVDDHQIKKLLLLFWEITDKTTAEGKLLTEMILVW